MGLADDVATVLHDQLKCQVAWLPISNTFGLGDYGIISHGVFTKMGNVNELAAPVQTAEGPPVALDFVSADTTVTNFMGNVKVDALPDNPAVDASINITFAKAGSFLLKARIVRVSAIENVNQVMTYLKGRPGWSDSFKLVTRLWTADKAALLSTVAADTTVVLGAKAPALQKFHLGEVDASVNVSKSRELGLQLLGVRGVIGLGLTRRKFFGGIDSMADGPPPIETIATGGKLVDDII